MNVLLHVARTGQWSVALGNSKNLKKLKPEANIELVVNASGIEIFKDTTPTLLEELGNLEQLGVHVVACRNALVGHGIDETSLPKSVEVVAAGILELAEKQLAGFSYVSP